MADEQSRARAPRAAAAALLRGAASTTLFPIASQRDDFRYAWRGPSMLLVDTSGWAGAREPSGWFFRQTRFLRDLRLRMDGRDPYPCSIAQLSPEELEMTFVHPEVRTGGGGGSGSGGDPAGNGLLFRNLDLRVRCRVRPASLEVILLLTSRWQHELDLPLEWLVSSDFATFDQAYFGDGEPPGAVPHPIECGVRFDCDACGVRLATHVTGTGADWQYGAGVLGATIRLKRQQPVELRLSIHAIDDADPIEPDAAKEREARVEAWRAERMTLHAPGETPFVEFANRAADDLGSAALLEGPREEWLTPGAGVPLYQSLWGRDALTATWQAGLLDRGAMLADVLTTLTRLQGRTDDPQRDEQPGRILNQAKTDLHARTGRTGFAVNYADVASPFMFIIGLGYHYVLTGDREHLASRYDAALRVAAWAERDGDRDGDGYIEYLTRSPHGPTHQGWKDSENAVVDVEGRKVIPPIAPCEIQGYRYVALQFMAGIALVMDEPERGAEFRDAAASLKERFNRDFWLEDEGYLAFGLGPDKQPIRALTSNAAQCLATGIVAREHVPQLVRRMFEPDLFSGWGIRTLSSSNPAYNPLDYHLGSVWPVENGSILFGLRRYGFDDRVEQLATALYDLARLWPAGRTPECVGGYGRAEAGHPGAYPRANRPQTWNQSIWTIMVQCLLGLVPFAPLKVLLVDPILPAWLPELSVRRLRVGDAVVDLRFRRDGDGHSHYEITERRGKLRIIRQPWLESFSADSWERLTALVKGIAANRKR